MRYGLQAEPDSGAAEDEPANCTVIQAPPSPPVGSVSRLDAEEIERRGARTLPDVLALEPSVEVNRSPKAGASLQLRGFDERAVLLLFEGIPIREVYDGHFDPGALPTFALASMEIERGVTSVLHGPNAAGGVISLKAPTACARTADVAAYAGVPLAGHLPLAGARATGCVRVSDVTAFLSGGYERSWGYALSGDYAQTPQNTSFHEQGGRRDGSDHDRATVATLVRWAPRPNKSLSLFVDALRSPRGIPPFEGSGYVRYWRFGVYDSLLVGLSGVYGPAPEDLPVAWGFRELHVRAYTHLHRDELRDYEDASYERLTTNPLAFFVASAYANETYGAAVQTSWALNAGNRLATSLAYTLDRNRQREIPVPRGVAETTWGPREHYASHSLSLAVEDTQRLGAWRLTAGAGASGLALLQEEIRGKDYPVTERILPAFEGRAVVDWEPIDGLRPMVAFGHKVRLPMLKELFSNSVGGNPDLEAERAWMVEAGLDTTDLPGPGFSTSTRVFFNDIRDLIQKYRDAYANVGHALTAGLELEARYAPVAFLQLVTAYRYLYSRDLDNDRPLDYRAAHRVRLGAQASSAWGLRGSLDATFASGQRAYYADALTGWVEDRLPGYALLHAHLRYDVAASSWAGLYLFLDAFNLLDAAYAVGSFDPRPGRELTLGVGGRM
jgi:iron complex outermembrane receptor protein/outer membrane receptor for ferrienterochelin and colicins